MLQGIEKKVAANTQAVGQSVEEKEEYIYPIGDTHSAPATAAQASIDPISNTHSAPASAVEGMDSLVRVRGKDSEVHEIKLTADVVSK